MRHKIFCLLSFFLLFPVKAETGYSLFINATEGGEVSNRKLEQLKSFLIERDCPLNKITAGIPEKTKADFHFEPLKTSMPGTYREILSLSVMGDEPLSSSILVRGSTAVSELKSLSGVAVAYLSPDSKLGFIEPQSMLQKAGVNSDDDKTIFTQSNLGAVSLLLHKDVFAAVIVTPLAKKWAEKNNLHIIATSNSIEAGAVWANNAVPSNVVSSCNRAFSSLTSEPQQNKALLKVFPEWITAFKVK